MLICYDLTTVSCLYVLTFYALFRVLFVYFILLYCLLFICVRLTRDSINETYLEQTFCHQRITADISSAIRHVLGATFSHLRHFTSLPSGMPSYLGMELLYQSVIQS